ncbi:hypothetical protein BCU70_09730 [Vibrio sp. 10N.286.49.C2]|uniref:hypothetical protein n=1 Tax=unclassified Vibrio TaxID=2614977 RepID=UPI000C81F9DA|nr:MULTISPECIES: hypothetical protein [unclassified Vibrio]PMH26420.1 hypothetical protein BCU70_09730 [Vibrio sp. 10N.286.49.C2]PMH54856.1 hypothetical protein BCU66_11205 [Vibrio sp. 10N.286.49.B1]PMH84094.1 hypothetical protein BCU58_00050 [Vibrio sp. 10N.286.48.B7]
MAFYRKIVVLLLINTMLSPSLFACAFHDLATDNLTEELSYTVGHYIKVGRTQGKIEEPSNDSMAMYLFLNSLHKKSAELAIFHFRQPIDGHMSTIDVTSKPTFIEYNPERTLPMLITEMDILWGLAQGRFTWQWVKSEGLATINGTTKQRSKLDKILSETYS